MKKHPNEIDREIGRRIKQRRTDLGLNQQSLAQQIGVSYQQVQKYENGTDRVGASRLFAVANALHCPVADFYERGGEFRETGPVYESSMDAQRVLSTEDGRLLIHAFLTIEDTAVRQKLVEFATTLSTALRRPPNGRRVRRRPRL
ncbi:helix-turn-helix domain-containing protein [Salinarimonas rosea]|uniref:helix-turn-helix domain-containing protein n=1 Tax=Salinarimonas rosea TaxID=552063 RepID=UPI00146FB224|nr:helix-turn-helix transcriptional regulator [Salinarimonas rosea]